MSLYRSFSTGAKVAIVAAFGPVEFAALVATNVVNGAVCLFAVAGMVGGGARPVNVILGACFLAAAASIVSVDRHPRITVYESPSDGAMCLFLVAAAGAVWGPLQTVIPVEGGGPGWLVGSGGLVAFGALQVAAWVPECVAGDPVRSFLIDLDFGSVIFLGILVGAVYIEPVRAAAEIAIMIALIGGLAFCGWRSWKACKDVVRFVGVDLAAISALVAIDWTFGLEGFAAALADVAMLALGGSLPFLLVLRNPQFNWRVAAWGVGLGALAATIT